MNISKNTWHYKVYAWAYEESYNYPPDDQTNLCSYWQTVILLPMFLGFLKLVYYVVMCGVVIPAVWIAGYKGNDIFNDNASPNRPAFLPYHSPVSILGFRIYPWHVICWCVPFLGAWLIAHYHGLKVALMVEGSVLGLVAIVVGSVFYFTSDTWRLAKEVIAAKKQGVCPVVNFTEGK